MPKYCIPENIPQTLKDIPQWVVWGVKGNSLKCPCSPATLDKARAGVPSTWGTFGAAVERVREGKAQGVGFEFHNNGIVGVDLDTVRNPATGEVSPEAGEIIKRLDSYTEISPSGYGFHIFVIADIALQANKRPLPGKTIVERRVKDSKGVDVLKKQEIEMYNQGHYFTVTGHVYEH
jgi:putative DNA primase/helicase